MKLSRQLLLGALISLSIGLSAGIAIGKKLQTAEKGEILGINHIAIATEDFEKSASYYRDTLGFPLAIEFKDDEGNPAWSYFQVSKNTFIELVPASPTRPAGLEHFGLETSGTESLLDHLRDLGLEVDGPRISSLTGIHIGTTKDPDGVAIEFIGAVPGSVHRKAMDDWDDKYFRFRQKHLPDLPVSHLNVPVPPKPGSGFVGSAYQVPHLQPFARSGFPPLPGSWHW